MSKTLAIDFTGKAAGLTQYAAFGDDLIHLLRNGASSKTLLVIDKGWNLPQSSICIVRDHLNLTGNNPLIGPNNPCGDRFPKVTDIYISDIAEELPKVITAGLKTGIIPNSEEVTAIKAVGAECWCYNLVPTMIVAAHAGWKVIGILVPDTTNTNIEAKLNTILQATVKG